MILNLSSDLVTESHVNAANRDKERVNLLLAEVCDRERAVKLAYKIVQITLRYPECYKIKFENPINPDSALYRMLKALGNEII
jgi:hypothetical protein